MSETQNKDKKPSTNVCPVCGAEVSNRRIYCPECGANVKSGAPRTTAPKKPQAEKPAPVKAPDETPSVDIATDEPRPIASPAADEPCPAPEPTEPSVDAASIQPSQSESDDVFGASAEQSAPQPQQGSAKDDYDYFDFKPNGEPFDRGAQPQSGNNDGKNVCAKCGTELPVGARFCGKCGAVQDRKCIRCGSLLAPDANFCKVCGSPQSGIAVVQAARNTPESKRRRSLRTVSFVWLIIGAVLGLVFMLTDFLTVNIYVGGERGTIAQDGFALIGIMFGGRSALTSLGVPIELLRFCGWLYLSVILVFIAAVACVILNSVRRSQYAPTGLFLTSCLYLALGIAVLAVSIVARGYVDPTELFDEEVDVFFYMGGIGVFVGSVVSFVGSLVAYLLCRKAFTDKPQKDKIKLAYFSGVVGLCVVIGALACAPALVGYSVNKVSPGGSGRATVRIAETLDDSVYGAQIIKLENLESGVDYEFSIRTDDRIDAEYMEDCLLLCYYDEVVDMNTLEIILSDAYFDTNQTSGNSTAKIILTADGARELAVVVCFAANTTTSLRFSYSLNIV